MADTTIPKYSPGSNTSIPTKYVDIGNGNYAPAIVMQAHAISDDTTLQNAAVATGVGTPMSVNGMDTLDLTVSGMFVGVITWEVSTEANPGASDWYPKYAAASGSGIDVLTATAPGIYSMAVTNQRWVRANITAYTSGSITVKGRASSGTKPTKSVALNYTRLTTSPVTGQRTISYQVATSLFAGAAKLAGRTFVTVKNTSSVTIYVGGASVTTTTGFPIDPGDSQPFPIDPNSNPDVYAIAAGTANVTVPVMEGK